MNQAFWRKSLTMTYFHTGTRTIIGAKSFSLSCSGWEGVPTCYGHQA